ncbi:hypothetical protein [Leifsonia sp. Leaf264]|uniref:hypothetical protein n=1 Tax=Leifsonia sp. Leaf264 TaxID=1736314 RepID=UPI0006FC9B48|nr:hypothetical protein [Leifsonia sp. Leaf264]KQP01301.1 hypothetical protein ASF30_01350 [Leifsonia sp. Leaf264]
MILRRAFYYALFPAAFVLPAWMLIGWGIFGHGGWGFLGLVIACPIVFIALVVIAALLAARPAVRRDRALSWRDVGVLTVLWGCIIGFGFFGDTTSLFAVLGALAAISAFWMALWELFTDGARVMRETMETFEQQAGPPPVQGGHYTATRSSRDGDDGEVIIIHESRD